MRRDLIRQAAPVNAPEPSNRLETISALKARVLEGDREAVDRLAHELKALAVESPTAETRALIDGLLDSKELDRFVDTSGITCRAGIVNAQLAMGFPYAMEVTPADLDLIRAEKSVLTGVRGTIPVRLIALLSLAWNGIFGLAAFLTANLDVRPNPWATAAGSAFVVAAVHALDAFAALSVAKPTATRKMRRSLRLNLKVLKEMIVLAPIVVVIAMVVFGLPYGLGAFALAGPFMLTAIGVAYHSSEMPPEPDDAA